MSAPITEAQKAAIDFYIALDKVRTAAKGTHTFVRHPLDDECTKASIAVHETFGGDRVAASEAIYAALRPGTLPRSAADRAPREATVREPRARAQRGARDPRIPPVGTTIYKRDRHGTVLAEALVVEDGIQYAGKVYGSPSAAGLAASTAVGLGTKAVDGYTFWSLNAKKEQT